MAKLYAITKVTATSYSVAKFDGKMAFPEIYYISEIGKNNEVLICTCMAGAKSICRHRKMLRTFQALDRVGKGWMYDYDKGEWHEPTQPDD